MTDSATVERRRRVRERAGVTVDVHAHAGLQSVHTLVAGRVEVEEQRRLEARRSGPASMAVTMAMLEERMPQLTRPDLHVAAMDRAGIDVQALSPSPGQYNYWADESLAVDICRAANDEIASWVEQYPKRFTGFGLVPLQHPELMPSLLNHAVAELGLIGVEISSFAPDLSGDTVELSDPRLDPFWSRAVELGALVFVHPLGCSLDERLNRFYLSNVVGQPVESAVALSHLVVGGVLDRHPGLRILASHGGGYLTTYLGRADHGWKVREDVQACADLPSSYMKRLYFDSLVHTPQALRMLVTAVGADRVLLGSDFPFDMGVDDPLDRLLDASLADHETDAIAAGNALHLRISAGLSPIASTERNTR